MSTKILEGDLAQMKAVTTENGTRTLDFYAAAFSATPDKNGDTIAPDAFDGWLAAFYKAGKPLPISFAHAAVRNDINPFEIIGYAPADPDHVWVDDYGLRVKAILDVQDNPTAAQVATLVDRGIVSGASIAFIAVREKRQNDGSAKITKIDVLEAGPCLTPANQDAVILGLKTAQELADLVEVDATEAETKVWNGDAAMAKCSTAADYRSICAGERSVGDPDERQHWALPHHDTPGGPANPDGVAAARARFSQTEGLVNQAAARTHLFETHKLPSDEKTAEQEVGLTQEERQEVLEALAIAAETKHGAAPGHLQTAHDALVRAGARCAGSEDVAAAKTADDYAARVRRIRLIRKSIV